MTEDPSKAFLVSEREKLGWDGASRMSRAREWVRTADISPAARSELELLTVTAGGVTAIERMMGNPSSPQTARLFEILHPEKKAK